jgi:hypothetical protein
MDHVGASIAQLARERDHVQCRHSTPRREGVSLNVHGCKLVSHQTAAGGQCNDPRLKLIARKMSQQQRQFPRVIGRIQRA